MKLLKTNKEYINELLECAKSNPRYFYFSSYNLSLDRYFETILNSLPKACDVKIIIGVNKTISKKQISFYKSRLGKYNLKLVKDHHLKILITNKSVILGGRNYTNSGWDDLSVKIPKKSTDGLISYFNTIYNKRNKI